MPDFSKAWKTFNTQQAQSYPRLQMNAAKNNEAGVYFFRIFLTFEMFFFLLNKNSRIMNVFVTRLYITRKKFPGGRINSYVATALEIFRNREFKNCKKILKKS